MLYPPNDKTNLPSLQSFISNLAIIKTYYWRVHSKKDYGFCNWSSKWLFSSDSEEAASPPSSWNFVDNSCNGTTIKAELVDEITNLTDNKYIYNSNKLSSGTYTVILNCDEQVLVRKLIKVKQ